MITLLFISLKTTIDVCNISPREPRRDIRPTTKEIPKKGLETLKIK